MDALACNSNGAGGGNWSAAATWNAGTCTTRPPGATEAVVILTTDTVNIDTTPITIASLTLNGAGRVNYTGGAKTLTVNGNVTMNNTSVFTVTASGGTNTHVLNLT